MNTYASTFISGTQNKIEVFLKSDIKRIQIQSKLDGLIIYDSDTNIDKIKALRYVNNSFFVLTSSNRNEYNSTSDFIKQLIKKSDIQKAPSDLTTGKKTFRIVYSNENNLTSIDKALLQEIENYFSEILNMKINRANPDTEVWILSRSEGIIFAGIRINKLSASNKILHKGELHLQMANIMCGLADLKSTDIVLDPFAGYGSIPSECENHFKAKKIFAGENDKNIFNLLKEKFSNTKIIIGKWDATNLNSLTDKSIDKIITDPPWGQFLEISEINNFYHLMLKEFDRLLKPDGFLVVLTSQKELLINQLKEIENFILINQDNILLSGKKVGLFVIKKKLAPVSNEG